MAVMIRDEKQFAALEEIEAALATIRQLNQIIRGKEEQATFQLGMTPARGRGVRVDIGPHETKAFFRLCLKSRTRLVRNVQTKANKFRIELSAEDLACMEDLAIDAASHEEGDDAPAEEEELEEADSENPPSEQDEQGESDYLSSS